MASVQHFCISDLLQLITQSAHHDTRLVNRWSVCNTEVLICKYNDAEWTSLPLMHYIPHKKGSDHLDSLKWAFSFDQWDQRPSLASLTALCLSLHHKRKKTLWRGCSWRQQRSPVSLLAWETVFQRSSIDLFRKEGLLETDLRNHFTVYCSIFIFGVYYLNLSNSKLP